MIFEELPIQAAREDSLLIRPSLITNRLQARMIEHAFQISLGCPVGRGVSLADEDRRSDKENAWHPAVLGRRADEGEDRRVSLLASVANIVQVTLLPVRREG